jgi:retron-type reverse transcriptase
MDMLTRAWQKVSAKGRCIGLDGVDISLYRSDLRHNLRSLQTSTVSGIYRPYTEKTYGSGNRKISIHCVDDKIIQTVVAEVIMSAYAPSNCVHGFIKDRSVFTAKKSLDVAIKEGISEYSKIDIKRFYDSVAGDILLRKLETLIRDSKFLSLVETII